MGRDNNVEIFENTEKLCKTNRLLRSGIESSKKKQKIIFEKDEIAIDDEHRYETKAKVIVSPKKSFEAAFEYANLGLKVAVHNFASATNPGGGVTKGAHAQEEDLCRVSTLYPCLSDKKLWEPFYQAHRKQKNPINNGDCIYTPDVIVFKKDTDYSLLPEEEWFEVDVITMAAPNLRTDVSNAYNPYNGDKAISIEDEKLKEIHEVRMRRLMEIAKNNGDEVVVLGAFGCGAFRNNPKVVAAAMRNISQEYKYDFKVIEFAVFCRNDNTENYEIFNETIE